MDRILLAVLIIAIFLFFVGIYMLYKPSRYQNSGTSCERNTMAVCVSIKNDYYFYGAVMIIISIMIGGLALFELFQGK
jgi:divalent metal cation (Fe/Co/Zn/Cd) transporter